MIKILVADRDIQQNFNSLKYFSPDKDIYIKKTNTEDETINSYIDIKPDVLILSTFFNGQKTSILLDKISSNLIENQKCNTILTTNNSDDLFNFKNISKIYRIIRKPFNDTFLLSTIKEIYFENNKRELTNFDLDILFLELNINRNSNGAEFLSEAINLCFYMPFMVHKLDNVLEKISINHGISKDDVRSCIRNTLKSVNINRGNNFKSGIYDLFDDRNITPKYFLNVITTYLHSKKH